MCNRGSYQKPLPYTLLTYGYLHCCAPLSASAVIQALFERKDPKNAKLIHIMSSGLKAGATWSRGEILQLCRECCGGQGFLSANKIGIMKNDMVRSRPPTRAVYWREGGCCIHLNAPMRLSSPHWSMPGGHCSHGPDMQDVDQTFEGDNSVMMQQVSKSLLEAATKKPPVLSTPSVTDSSLTDHSALLQLLQFR